MISGRSPVAFRCTICREDFHGDCSGAQEIRCDHCGRAYPVVNGVPVFLPESKISGLQFGLAETSFRSPVLYQTFVTLKSCLHKDAKIGVAEYIRGKHVLDVGCGPTLRSEYREYLPEEATSVTGLDASTPFALNARRMHPEPKYFFAVGSIGNIPFPDKAFDTTVVSFVIHHVPPIENIMAELTRVTREHLVIYDHLQSDNRVAAALQRLYWRLADGGCNYMTAQQWNGRLSGMRIEKYLRTGAIFGHVVKFVLRVPCDSPSLPRQTV